MSGVVDNYHLSLANFSARGIKRSKESNAVERYARGRRAVAGQRIPTRRLPGLVAFFGLPQTRLGGYTLVPGASAADKAGKKRQLQCWTHPGGYSPADIIEAQRTRHRGRNCASIGRFCDRNAERLIRAAAVAGTAAGAEVGREGELSSASRVRRCRKWDHAAGFGRSSPAVAGTEEAIGGHV